MTDKPWKPTVDLPPEKLHSLRQFAESANKLWPTVEILNKELTSEKIISALEHQQKQSNEAMQSLSDRWQKERQEKQRRQQIEELQLELLKKQLSQMNEASPSTTGLIAHQHQPRRPGFSDENTQDKPQATATTKGRRNEQIDLICETARQLGYEDLMSIPEGGRAKIKTECLKHHDLFTDDGFKKAWTEAGRRKIISMKDKEKYLSNQ